MNIKKSIAVLIASAIGLTAAFAADKVEVDPKLKDYAPVSGISGTINSIGSDTLNNLMTFWAEGFKAKYPNVNIQVEGKGSATAPPALIEGTAQLGPMSRPMKQDELDKFEKKFGYKPLEIKVAIDALAVFVNKDNKIEGLSLDQVDGIFSSTYKRGGKNISTWGELNMTGDWASRQISVFGRNSASGTYGFFKEHALIKGDFKNTVKEQPGSSAVVQSIASDLYAIGYSGIGYKTAGVRAIPLSSKSGGKAFEPTLENCLSGDYPMSRFLYIYVNKAPGKPLDPLVHQFLTFITSKDGQLIVVKDGYYPLPADISEEDAAAMAK